MPTTLVGIPVVIYTLVIRADEMAELLRLREMAEQMGLQGQKAVAFVREQQ